MCLWCGENSNLVSMALISTIDGNKPLTSDNVYITEKKIELDFESGIPKMKFQVRQDMGEKVEEILDIEYCPNCGRKLR